MVLDESESTRSSSDSRSKSPFKSLASEDSLGISNSSGSRTNNRQNDNWVGFFDDLPKRSAGSTLHSLASTATLTSLESNPLNNSFSNSTFSNSTGTSNNSSRSNRSPNHKSKHMSPRRSPRPGMTAIQAQARQIGSLPLSTANGHAPVDDRSHSKNGRRYSNGDRGKGMDGPPQDGQASYYQPSKASMKVNQPPKKPQRIRSRSKTVMRRKSHGEPQTASMHSERTTSSGASGGTSKRSKSLEPNGGNSKTKKKTSPPASRSRKKHSSSNHGEALDSTASFHESWPQPQRMVNKEQLERQRQRERQAEKAKRKKQSTKTKVEKSPKPKKKELKDGNDSCTSGSCTSVNDVITFFEDMAAHKAKADALSGTHPGRKFERSNSARCVSRSRSPASASIGAVSLHSAPMGNDDDLGGILDPSNKRRQRRSSAPAKALAAFQQYRKSIGAAEFAAMDDDSPESAPNDNGDDLGGIMDPSNKRRQRRSSAPAKALAAFSQYRKSIGAMDFEDFDDPPQEKPKPVEKVLLDVSELAALEIIRLGKDNSLKLDLFDLVNHLKKQQLKKSTTITTNR